MRCDLDPTRVAVWWSPEHLLKLSAFAAKILSDAKLLSMDKLNVHRTWQRPETHAGFDNHQ